MHISFEGRSGLWVALIALAGMGALVIAPHPYDLWIGWSLLGMAGIGAFLLLWHHALGGLSLTWKPGQRSMMVAVPVMIACMLGFFISACVFLWKFGENNRPSNDLHEVVAELDAIRSDINKYVLPRTLTDEQSKALVAYLLPREHYLIYIVYSDEDQEAKDYANQLWRALKEASWDPRMTPTDVGGRTPTRMAFSPGVRINYTIAKEPFDGSTKAASLLARALSQANIPCSGGGGGSSKTSIDADVTELMVGPRPLAIAPPAPYVDITGRLIVPPGSRPPIQAPPAPPTEK